jgi:membrane protein
MTLVLRRLRRLGHNSRARSRPARTGAQVNDGGVRTTTGPPPRRNPADMSHTPSKHRPRRDRIADRARQWLAAVGRRFEGSWLQDLNRRLNAIDFANAIVMFGASLLLSALPLIILLSSAANERVDDDLSRHMGLSVRGARIMEELFRKTPSHASTPIILGVIIAFAGTVTVASALQVIYERAFDQKHRGWRDIWRFIVWVVVLLGVLILDGSIDLPLRRALGDLGRDFVSFVEVAVFLWWTMHFLLAGRVYWGQLIRPAFLSGLLWFGFALFSSVYFSSALISEDKLYGTLGVVFILMTWFIAIGAVVVLGAACGAVWQARTRRSPAVPP